MKKFLVSMMAAFMVFAIAGSAAAFSNGSLTAVIYNKTDKEVALDLGNVLTLDFTQQNATLAAAGSFNLSDYNAISSFSELKVGIYAKDTSVVDGEYAYFATTMTTNQGISQSTFENFWTTAGATYTNYGAAAAKAVKPASNSSSYWKKMDQNSTPGSYAGFNAAVAVGEAVLPELGYVDMYLYKYGWTPTYEVALVPGATTEYIASFRIFTDGSIVMNAATSPVVPVPGAFILMFSGLLGLVGIRRKA